jgi:predicted Zn-dependent peptidase
MRVIREWWLVALVLGAAVLAGTLGAQSGRGSRASLDRSKPPALSAAPMLTLPAIEKHMLSNGLPVWVVQSHEVPLVQVNLLVQAGADDDPAGKFGVASMTAAMLDEGAGQRTALEIADAVDFLGADLETTSAFDASAVRLNVPVAKLADALPIMADVALRPTFAQSELDRLRQEQITAILQSRDDPAAVVPQAFARIVFGTIHRYGTPAMGTITTLKGFTPADLRTFHAARYQPSNATLIVTGDVQSATVLPMLEKAFGSWANAGPVSRAPVPVAAQVTEREIDIVDIPGAAQSQIRIGWVGVARSTPDYFTLQVLNTILGGSFTSRLNQNLREEHQYTYGASSRFDMRLSPASFAAGAGVQTDKTADALKEFFNELNGIGKPVEAAELNKAKSYITLSFPSEFETIDDLSQHLEEMVVYKLPDDYFNQYAKRIEAVTSANVADASAKYIQPAKFKVVVVGDRKVIEPGIRALNLGTVKTMSVVELLGP